MPIIWKMFRSSTLEASVFMGTNNSGNLHSIKNTGNDLTMKQMFDIWKVDNRTIRWDFWSVSNQLGRFFMEIIIFDRWWRSHQLLVCKGLCIFRFCVMSWKGESESNIKYCLGRTVELVQRFTTIQNFGHNWRRADGIRVTYFPRINHTAAPQKSPRVSVEKGRKARSIDRTDHLHVDFQWHLMGILRQWIGMRIERQLRLYLCEKIFTRKMVISRTWIRKEVVFYLHWQATRRLRQSRRINDGKICRKRTPSFPCRESIVPRNAQKQRWWNIINTLLRWWGNDWNCLWHNYFCQSAQYLRSSLRFVWRIQSLSSKNGETRAGRTIWPIVRASKIVDDNTYTFD